ncbi:hypothetical protein GCM10010470_12800 [Saccharopolyspora taberi]|uniref:Tetratricopeptide repeat protein n=2 Tax=Saccharopolyspora taberi TaxID=60895 RepID=A0ABN3V8R1_9PSEU
MGVQFESEGPWLPPSDLHPLPVTEEDVADLEKAASLLAEVVAADGWRAVVVAEVSWGEHLIGSDGADEHGRRLLAVVGELHNLAGWAAFDDGELASTRAHFLRAISLAHQSGYSYLLLSVLYRMGRVYLYVQVPHESLKCFQLAQIIGQELDCPVELAIINCNEAWAYGQLGHPDQVTKMIRRMHDELERLAFDGDAFRTALRRLSPGEHTDAGSLAELLACS